MDGSCGSSPGTMGTDPWSSRSRAPVSGELERPISPRHASAHESLKVLTFRGHKGWTLGVSSRLGHAARKVAPLKHFALQCLWTTSLASLVAAAACSSDDSNGGAGAGTGGTASQTGGSGGAQSATGGASPGSGGSTQGTGGAGENGGGGETGGAGEPRGGGGNRGGAGHG